MAQLLVLSGSSFGFGAAAALVFLIALFSSRHLFNRALNNAMTFIRKKINPINGFTFWRRYSKSSAPR
ncbi:hypothetical protein [Pseudoramibacter alactolyticus]|uniref:hypothetical protein n=1 Tax=Pseudoramibacter alactolyticus TaxID=113287 RepID=UPI0023578A01|nr:hypothetical protein [Pseudoramibacter alactolyticus]